MGPTEWQAQGSRMGRVDFARLHSLCPSVEAFPLFSVESTTAPIELLEVWGPVFDPGEYD